MFENNEFVHRNEFDNFHFTLVIHSIFFAVEPTKSNVHMAHVETRDRLEHLEDSNEGMRLLILGESSYFEAKKKMKIITRSAMTMWTIFISSRAFSIV